MIKALASYQFGPGASPGVDVILYLVTDPYLQSRIYSYFEKGCREKCTRQSWKALWVVLSSLFFKEI